MIKRLLNAAILGLAAILLGATGAEPPVTHQDVTRSWADAWNSHDITKVLALFAKDIEIDQPENSKPLDYDGARKFFSMIFKAYPDFHVTVVQAIVDGRSAVSVERVTGTWTAPSSTRALGKLRRATGATSIIQAPWCCSMTRTENTARDNP
jgi:steroid delta-isomerase-like uncharacterized protein